jgi:hypothetical protein
MNFSSAVLNIDFDFKIENKTDELSYPFEHFHLDFQKST